MWLVSINFAELIGSFTQVCFSSESVWPFGESNFYILLKKMMMNIGDCVDLVGKYIFSMTTGIIMSFVKIILCFLFLF